MEKKLNDLRNKFKKKKLIKEQEKSIILCIRYSYLYHSDLMNLMNEPLMNDYKDLLLQGLSAKLNNYENKNNNNMKAI